MLQSRPMTSTKSYTTWEIMHEFDSAVMSDEDYFTFGNVGEIMPEPMTPLSISVTIPAFEKGLLHYSPIPVAMSKFANTTFGISHFRFAINVFNFVLKAMKTEITFQNRLHELSLFGHAFITDEIEKVTLVRETTRLYPYLTQFSFALCFFLKFTSWRFTGMAP